MQVLASAVNALAPAQRGQLGRWPAAWSGSEGFSSPAEELILSMQSPHAQVSARQGVRASACMLLVRAMRMIMLHQNLSQTMRVKNQNENNISLKELPV